MPDFSADVLLQSLAEALQTIAFICPEPPPEVVVPPADVDLFSLRFTGQVSGEFELAAPRAFGEVLAANMLALEPSSPEARMHGPDAIKELCNITTGSMLRQRLESTDFTVEIGLPVATAFPDTQAWQRFISQSGVLLIIAEGHPLAARVKELS